MTGEPVTAQSSEARLRDLAVTDGVGTALELSPAFSSGTRAYTVSVGHAVTTVGVTARARHAGARLSGSLRRAGSTTEPVAMRSGRAAELSELAAGAHVLTVVVTAEDGTRREYTLTVTRRLSSDDAVLRALAATDGAGASLELSPVFSSATTAYTAMVGGDVTTARVTATVSHEVAALSGSLTKAGGPAETVTMRSGVAATLSDLAVGDNVLTITVTAEDDTMRVYALSVTRADTQMRQAAVKEALAAAGRRARYFRERLRALFMDFRLPDWETLYRALAFGHRAPVPILDTS